MEIISELHNLTVLEGDDATFKAVVSPDDVALKWQHHGQDIVPSERFATTRVGLCHTLTIQQCRLSDTGIVTVHAEGLVSSARLSVQGKKKGDASVWFWDGSKEHLSSRAVAHIGSKQE